MYITHSLYGVFVYSTHSTFKDFMNDAIIHAIFGDGCAACVMTAQPKYLVPRGTLCITEDHGWLMQGTDDGITLAINHDGISCTLSKHLPTYIAQVLNPLSLWCVCVFKHLLSMMYLYNPSSL
jgi:alpha-pyrone synthase